MSCEKEQLSMRAKGRKLWDETKKGNLFFYFCLDGLHAENSVEKERAEKRRNVINDCLVDFWFCYILDAIFYHSITQTTTAAATSDTRADTELKKKNSVNEFFLLLFFLLPETAFSV